MIHEYPYSIKRHGTTLDKCEDEPVQTPGCIQSFGVLLVLRTNDLTILQVSENCRHWLGFSPQELLSQNVNFAVGEVLSEKIRGALVRKRAEKAPLYLETLNKSERRKSILHVSLHTCSGLALLELEDTGTEAPDESAHQIGVEPDYYGLVRETLTRFQQAGSLRELSQFIAEEVHRITELDRVMVYRFHADDSGEIIAEAKREDLGSWFGWRYPAHDIPKPAREIFKKIWSRPVPDVRSGLFEMVPLLNPDTQKPLDMTYCSLRGASVMYTEYLDNMGVRAALTLPLMRDGELWGLVACHHNSAQLISYRVRAACEFLARAASQQLKQAEDRENTDYRVSLEAANYALISKVAVELEISAFTEGPIRLGSGMDCGGAAILYQGWHTVGKAPDVHDLEPLSEWLLRQQGCQEGSSKTVFVTDHLSEAYPLAKEFALCASGLMAFCFSREPLGMILYFRPETLQTFTWAGNPHELPVVQGPHGPRLSPRKSFELWRETVTDRSMPWKAVEIEAVRKLRSLVVDLLVSRAKQLNALRTELKSTKQQAAEAAIEAGEKFRMAVEAGDLGTWEYVPATDRLEFSARCDELFDSPPGVIVDYATFLDAVHPDDRAQTDGLIQQALDPSGSKQYETEYRTNRGSSGKTRWIRAAGKTILSEHGQVTRFIGTVQDITAGKEALELQKELTQRAQAAEKAKSEFLAIMSHEIRTPLNGVIGMTNILADTELNEMQRDCVGTVLSSGESLLTVINDILDYSKIEAGRLQMESRSFSLQNCIEEVLDLFAVQIRNKGLEVVYLIASEIPDVSGDEVRLRQILVNLVGNAIKFTANGEISINVECKRIDDEGCHLLFSVADTGIGIPEEGVQKLFQPFQQVDTSTTRRYGGTGLGLVISKRLAEFMGGTMWVESEPGVGSTFLFTATFQVAPTTESRKMSTSPEHLKDRSVLVVDDNATNRRILEIQLKNWGIIPTTVDSGTEALALVSGKKFDAVLLDLVMPDTDGITLARKIHTQAKVPLILLSSGGEIIVGEDATIFDAQIPKPIKHSALFNALLKAIGILSEPSPKASLKKIDAGLAARHPLRILIAEDNAVNQKVGLTLLSRMGYTADLVNNGRRAVEAAANATYDLILMDIQMPEMNGMDAARLVREKLGEERPAIIALTAEALEGDEQKFLGMGFDGYLSKPLKIERLQAVLEFVRPLKS